GQTVTLQGGLITASRGVGYDLLAVLPEADDPVARPRPPQDWPQQIERLYTLPGPGPEGQTVRVTCTFVRLQPETLEIVERPHETVVFEERCRGDARFVNAHHADIETGTVWQSTQWIGPVQGAFTYEMIEPFAPD
ncbi:MAG: YjbF family lipoprotein, partial [Pseudomonadota bacterium]